MLIKQINKDSYLFWCPACEDPHVVGGEWTFNESYSRPSIKPSVYVADGDQVCHLFITNGRLLYLPDTTHALSERTVDMPEIPDWLTNAPDDPQTLVQSEDLDEDDGFYYPELPESSDIDLDIDIYGNKIVEKARFEDEND